MYSKIFPNYLMNWTIGEIDMNPKKRKIPLFTVITTIHVALLKATSKGI